MVVFLLALVNIHLQAEAPGQQLQRVFLRLACFHICDTRRLTRVRQRLVNLDVDVCFFAHLHLHFVVDAGHLAKRRMGAARSAGMVLSLCEIERTTCEV